MNRNLVGIIPVLLIALGIFSSCEEESNSSPSLITEEILFVSGDRARILARVLTTQSIGATDHGFYIDSNEGFSQPQIISLGERDRPGRFIGETDALNIEENYFVKAFIEIGSEIQFGNVLTLKTLEPTVFDFAPTNGSGGLIIYIAGKNFTTDTQVYFGDRPAEVLDIRFESRISVRVPPIGDLSIETLKVVSQRKEMVLSHPFEYTVGKYFKISNFPNPEGYVDNIYFQQGSQFFVGLGTDRGLDFIPKIFQYDLGSNQWRDTNFPGRPSFMSFASTNYFGAGASELGRAPFVLSGDFWNLKNGSYKKLPDLPFQEANAVSFEINDNLFVVGGIIGDSISVFRYNSSSADWRRLSNAPFPINNSVINFTYQNNQYFINPNNRDLVYFEPGTQNWQVVGTYPGELGSGGGFGVALDNRIYVGLANRSQQIWELNMSSNNWARKNDFPGTPIARNAAVFVQNEMIYFLRSPEVQVPGPMEFWSFDPKGF